MGHSSVFITDCDCYTIVLAAAYIYVLARKKHTICPLDHTTFTVYTIWMATCLAQVLPGAVSRRAEVSGVAFHRLHRRCLGIGQSRSRCACCICLCEMDLSYFRGATLLTSRLSILPKPAAMRQPNARGHTFECRGHDLNETLVDSLRQRHRIA
jgi:hypothetical protein